MSYSYYEVYTNAQRAFSGLGFPYGADEDAAYIISWLEAFNLEGIQLFSKVQKKIDEETKIAEEEIKKFKNNSVKKVNSISEGITSELLKEIFGEDINKSSIEAAVSQVVKEHEVKKI